MPRIHPRTVSGTFRAQKGMMRLGRLLATLRYRSLYWVLQALSSCLADDAKKDFSEGRTKLSGHLQRASGYVAAAAREISEAWRISEPYMYGIKELPRPQRPTGNENRFFLVTREDGTQFLVFFRADDAERTWFVLQGGAHRDINTHIGGGLFGVLGHIEEAYRVAICTAVEVTKENLPDWACAVLNIYV